MLWRLILMLSVGAGWRRLAGFGCYFSILSTVFPCVYLGVCCSCWCFVLLLSSYPHFIDGRKFCGTAEGLFLSACLLACLCLESD